MVYCTVVYKGVVYCGVLRCTVLWCIKVYCTEFVPRREEGSTGKYQHEVEFPRAQPKGTPETEFLYFPVLPEWSQGTDIIPFIKVMKL